MQGAELRMLRMFVGALVLMTTVLGVLVGIGSSPAAMLQRSEPATSWVSSVRAVDEALQRDDVSAAVRAWRDAYGIALASRRWEAMIDVANKARVSMNNNGQGRRVTLYPGGGQNYDGPRFLSGRRKQEAQPSHRRHRH